MGLARFRVRKKKQIDITATWIDLCRAWLIALSHFSTGKWVRKYSHPDIVVLGHRSSTLMLKERFVLMCLGMKKILQLQVRSQCWESTGYVRDGWCLLSIEHLMLVWALQKPSIASSSPCHMLRWRILVDSLTPRDIIPMSVNRGESTLSTRSSHLRCRKTWILFGNLTLVELLGGTIKRRNKVPSC